MRTDKPLTLYWLGNDLMWIKFQIHRGESYDVIHAGIESVRQYLIDLEADPIVVLSLWWIDEFIKENETKMAWNHIENIKRYIHNEMLKSQPNFKKLGMRKDDGIQ